METMARLFVSQSPLFTQKISSRSVSPAPSSAQFRALSLYFRANKIENFVLTKGKKRIDLRCSASDNKTIESTERWLLEPVGDGDYSHIGYKVARPGAFEIASNSVTVGRVKEQADIVLPVATVSGLHARLEKKNGSLLVTDLDSTNGTYIDEKKLRPGSVTPVQPGSFLTFGDSNLAIFRVSKIKVEPKVESEETEIKTKSEGEVQTVSSEASSG
ncbi:hypothetical protein LUZ60_015491 [Juncus effusus]|nr:hypothetical protein LUZ60_015491 [Juncus effusus]